MYPVRFLFVAFLIFCGLSAFCQNKDAVFMKWKLKPAEVISYKTSMDEIDTANHRDFDMSGMAKLITGEKDTSSQKFFKKLSKLAMNSSFVTHLKLNKNKLIQIEMLMNNDKPEVSKDTTRDGKNAKEMQDMLSKMTSGVMLRATINENGEIESFYTKKEQKNLVALFFELPGRAVSVGDSWPVSVSFISMDQNFICDSSFRTNIVTVTAINDIQNEHIVILKYDIVEFVKGDFSSPFNNTSIKTTMKMTYQAVAQFSIEKGKWLGYDGIMSLSSSGLMDSQTTKKFALVEE
jgi:hypothetical protein